jgi:NitT/TauT family transport system permease protein
MKKIFLPNFFEKINPRTIAIITIIQAVIFLLLAQFNGNELIPKPLGVIKNLVEMLSSSEFYNNLISTFFLIVKGMGLAIIISLTVSYLSLIPAFKGIPSFVSKLRFLTYTGLVFVFTILLHDGSQIKTAVLLLGIVPYFVTSLLSYFNDIPKKEYELCYTLKMNKWQTLYEVVIRGRLHVVLEVVKQNFAIAWMMITSVEGLCMSEGGIGTLMNKANRVVQIDKIFAILVAVFILGILFDYLFDILKVWFFPYTDTKRYRNLLIHKIFRK